MNRQLLTRGMTLIELLLALTLGLLVTAAAWQGLRLGRQALASLEQQQQLQDQLRLSRDWLPRLLRQLFEKLHNMTDVEEVVRTSAAHEVDFLPPEANE